MNSFLALLITVFLSQRLLCEVKIYNKLEPIFSNSLGPSPVELLQNDKLIGILTLPLSKILRNKMAKQLLDHKLIPPDTNLLDYFIDTSYFPSSYAKWLKEHNVEVLPIDINDDLYSILEAVEAVDGLLLTGGAVPLYLHEKVFQIDPNFSSALELKEASFYTRIVKEIIKLVKSINDKGDRVFPLWATCLGFESLILNESNLNLKLDVVRNNNVSESVNFKRKKDLTGSRFMDFFGSKGDAINRMRNEKIFFFNHDFGFLESHFKRNTYMNDNYHLIATTKAKGKPSPIIGIIENKHYPIFGVQFHPEKNKFEHNKTVKANRSTEALEICSEMASFFVSQVKKSRARKMKQIQNWIVEERNMRYTLYVETNVGVFDEMYFFKKHETN